MAQFHFRTRKILWLRSYAVTLPYNKFSTTWSFAVSLPYKSFDFKSRSSTSAQRISCDLKFRSFASAQGIYYVSRVSSSAFANRQSVTWSSSVSHNILRLEFPQFRFCKKRRHLKFRTSASAREHDFSLENPLSFNHPPISQFSCWLTWLMDPLKDRETKESGCSWQKSSLTFGCARIFRSLYSHCVVHVVLH